MSDVAQRSYHFGQAFLNEFIEFGTSSLAGLPCSAIFVTILFMLDTTLRSATAKLYFVCGYFIELLLFYSFSVICFPNERSTTSTAPSRNQRSNNYDDGLDEGFDDDVLRGGGDDRENKLLGRVRFLARPFQSYTSASFFNFSAGYILGYWGNLNILNGTRNAVIVVCYYVAFVLFAFLMSVFYFQHGEHGGTCSWQSGVLSNESSRVTLDAADLAAADTDQLEAFRAAVQGPRAPPPPSSTNLLALPPAERESVAIARRLRRRLDSFARNGDCRRGTSVSKIAS